MAHMHYTGTGQTHSFRGMLDDAGQERIRIQGSVGSIAWRITKFQCMQSGFGNTEMVVKIYREEQNFADAAEATLIDFNQNELLGACMISGSAAGETHSQDVTIIFDNSLFSRNIWITADASSSGQLTNYYIELEEVKVSQAGMAQLAVAAARRTYVPGT